MEEHAAQVGEGDAALGAATAIWHSWELPGFILKPATGEILRVPDDSDDVEGRVGGYFNLGCSAPGWNGVAALPS